MNDMNVTSAQHIAEQGKNIAIKATIDGQTLGVPLDTANRHYAAILEWAKEDGNTIQEAD